MDHFYVLFFTCATLFGLDKFGLWHDFILKYLGSSPAWHFLILPYVVINLTFYTFGLLLTHFDLKKTSNISKYKIQPGTNQPLTFSRFLQLLKLVTLNQILVGFLGQYLFYLAIKNKNIDITILPSILQVLAEFIFFTIIEEFFFFYAHWAFHTRFLYAKFHKIHHEWVSSVALGINHKPCLL